MNRGYEYARWLSLLAALLLAASVFMFSLLTVFEDAWLLLLASLWSFLLSAVLAVAAAAAWWTGKYVRESGQ